MRRTSVRAYAHLPLAERRRADDHGALGGLTVAVRRTITGAARERRDRLGCPVLPRV